jgi:hypothetical protein
VKPFDSGDAWAIQKKLKAEVKEGRKHTLVTFRHNGVAVIHFGIRRGTKGGHGFLPGEMKITQKQCREFRQCTMSLEQYVAVLTEKQIISPP